MRANDTSNHSPIQEWRSQSSLSRKNLKALSELSGEQIAELAAVFGSGSWRCSATIDETAYFYDFMAAGLLGLQENECSGKPYELTLNAEGYGVLKALSEGLSQSISSQAEVQSMHQDAAADLAFLPDSTYSILAVKFGSLLKRTPRSWLDQCVEDNETTPNFPGWVALHDARLIDFNAQSCANRPFALSATAMGRWAVLHTYAYWEAQLKSL